MIEVLFRESLADEGELEVCKKYFGVSTCRTLIPEYSLVIARYSALPYYNELELDLQYRGCELINSYHEHKYIANFEYYYDVKDYTFETVDMENLYKWNYDGPMVVKGKTNSKKFQWNHRMFASNKAKAMEVASDLMCDSYLGDQGIIFRKYEPLKTYEIGVAGLPFTHEFRLFYYKTTLLTAGYYWSLAEKIDYELDNAGYAFAAKIAGIISKNVNFFVLDIAQKVNGEWVLVEVNDGQMSGLSCNSAESLYKNLSSVLKNVDN